ncbi:dimethylamine monooxygenase subunit DmmA family protein [Rhodococcus sp. NPDC058639]|uniref:dimethylamine monooxygenase subunit DmmA family protein n=1 Tax=Rhodococcus sp. NPDC058639 TaxID=3346570 RepID=UPI003659E038
MRISGFRDGPLPEIDLTGRSFLIFRAGQCAAAEKAVRQWSSDAVIRGKDFTVVDDPALAHAEVLVENLRVGGRVMIAGPAPDAMALTAAARRAGALPCETVTHITESTTVAVFCPHCDTTHRVDAVPGDRVVCCACGIGLEIRPHLSSHHGTYLGAVA